MGVTRNSRTKKLRHTVIAVLCLIAGYALCLCPMVSADEWVSPEDKKYSAKNSALFGKMKQARGLFNQWRGEGILLEQVGVLLNEVLSEDPTFAPALLEAARLLSVYPPGGLRNKAALASIRSPENAIQKSLELEPNYADAYVLMGYRYKEDGRYEEALTALDKAQAIGTSNPWLLVNRGLILEKQKKYDEALVLFRKVVDSGTSNRKALSAALDEIADTLRKTKKYDLAHEAYKKAVAFEPESAWKRGNYSEFLLFEVNDIDGAIKEARTALQLMDYGVGRFALASALYTKWAYALQNGAAVEEAEGYYQEAAALFPDTQSIIKTAKRYEFTRLTVAALRKRLADGPVDIIDR